MPPYVAPAIATARMSAASTFAHIGETLRTSGVVLVRDELKHSVVAGAQASTITGQSKSRREPMPPVALTHRLSVC